MNKKIIVILLIVSGTLFGKDEEPGELPQIGNFALPASQQAIPLFSFGQYILNKGVLQTYAYYDCIRGNQEKYDDLTLALVYGISDSLSLVVAAPFALQAKTEIGKTAGIQDIFVQLEHAVYTKYKHDCVNQATILFNMSFPTGSPVAIPPIGVGSSSIFLGATFSHMSIDWYYYFADGVTFSFPHDGIHPGTQLFYQAGFGRNLYHFKNVILITITEFNGYFATPDKCHNKKMPNTGGNSLYLGQSLWLSTPHWVFQLGVSGVPYQKLNGVQPKENYFIAGAIAYTF